MKIQGLILIITGLLLALWIGWGLFVIYSTERPAYEVTETFSSNIEVRKYAEQTWISTAYQTDDASFPILASYIFGRNEEKESIAMTAPVITDQKMSFILPAGVSAQNAPTPDGQAIEFKTVPARKLATLKFSWFTPQSRVEKTSELLGVLEANDVQTLGQPFLMRYNDPWTPPFLRRNEVAIEVR